MQILTNEYLLNEDIINKLKHVKDKVVVQISLDGSSSQSHDFQRNYSGAFQKTIQNIRYLTENGILTFLSMVLNKRNLTDIYDGSMFSLAEKCGVKLLGIVPSVIKIGHAVANANDFLLPSEVYEVIRYLQKYKEEHKTSYIINISAPPALTRETSLSEIKKVRPRCRRGVNSFSIKPNGDICVCSDFMELDYKEYLIGNILTANMDQISKKLGQIQKDKMESIYKLKGVCSICKKLPYCGGACRADAYGAYHDILAPYSLCQELYDIEMFPDDMIDKQRKYIEFMH